MMESMEAKMDSNQEIQARMEAKMETNRERDRDDLKRTMAEMNAKMDGNQTEMRSTICAIWSELEETIQQETKYFLSYVDQKTQNLRNELTETIEKAQNYRE
jgi:hypothetical protein